MESKTYFKDNNHLQNVEKLAEAIAQSDAILVGAAAGMSAACGFDFFYSNDAMFRKYLGEFGAKYGYVGAFNGFYYRYPSSEARWAFLARMCYMEYECPTGQPYYDLMNLLRGKNYHIMTTNQDFQFTRVMPEEKLSAIQGDSRYFQCSRRCHDEIFYNRDMIYAMNDAIDENLCIPTELIPRCPKCGGPMEIHMEGGPNFISDTAAQGRYQAFLERYHGKKLVVLELGVGWRNQLIKAPLMRLVAQEPNSAYVTINLGEIYITDDIKARSFGLDGPLSDVLSDLRQVCGV